MRRVYWFGLFAALASCNESDDDDDHLVQQVTRMSVLPDDFLGPLSCGLEGGVQAYQATLLDVTDGLQNAFVLPSSSVVHCRSQIFFEFVEPGRKYIAQISAFATTDVQSQFPGSSVIVDDFGRSVVPDWSTTCWGRDSQTTALGGAGGEASDIGATALELTVVRVRGCEPLEVGSDSRVAVDLSPALFGLECGDGPGELARFQVFAHPDEAELFDGLGGSGGEATGGSRLLGEASCDERVVVGGLPAGIQTNFMVLAFEEGQQDPTWTTTCTALTRPGVTTPARCNPVL